MTKLKPCPFCGSNNVKIHMPYIPFATDCYMVQCYDCDCNTAIYESAKNAAEAWNRRTEMTDKDAYTEWWW